MVRFRPYALFAVCALALFIVNGPGRSAREPESYSETHYVFGTLVEIVIFDADPAVAAHASGEVARFLRRVHRDWHAWRKGGELSRLNAAIAQGDAVTVSDDLADVLRDGQRLSKASKGLFEPAIGALIALWGFHDDLPPQGAPPPDVETARLTAAHPRIADLRFDGAEISSVNPAVQLDLGGFAKGAALDRAAKILRENGVENAVLNAGGDVNILGQHGAREWRVAIRDPFGWGPLAVLPVHPGEVVYTSGNYERFLEHDGIRFSHILDPRTGRPVTGIVSATVLGVNGAHADAAATALSVAGPGEWLEIARAMGVDTALLIDDGGRILATPKMAARLAGGWPEGLIIVTPAGLSE